MNLFILITASLVLGLVLAIVLALKNWDDD